MTNTTITLTNEDIEIPDEDMNRLAGTTGNEEVEDEGQ